MKRPGVPLYTTSTGANIVCGVSLIESRVGSGITAVQISATQLCVSPRIRVVSVTERLYARSSVTNLRERHSPVDRGSSRLGAIQCRRSFVCVCNRDIYNGGIMHYWRVFASYVLLLIAWVPIAS